VVARLVVAAPASGHGKTSVATGLLAALRARGLTVAPAKVGPDYIDPSYHALAAGRAGRNLDPFLVGPDRIAPLFRHGAAGADVAVVEGAMGLFDGRNGGAGFASTAHVADLLAAPVLLVVDARGQGESVAALVHGFTTYRPGTRIAGVLLNQVGSDRHEAILRDALAGAGVPVLGALRRDAGLVTPSRHLGLVPAAERTAEAAAGVNRLGAWVAAGVDLDAVLAVARSAAPLPGPPWDPAAEVGHGSAGHRAGSGSRPVVAVAGGPAFTFGYPEHVELLAAAGAEVVTVDPARDTALPAGTRAVVLGGGFPEEYATALAGNAALRGEVAAFAGDGGVVAAECAGLLYLTAALDEQPMCGVLPAEATMTGRLTLGYREAVAVADSVFGPAGQRVRGHEFHRTTVAPRAGATPAWQWSGDGPEGFVTGRVHASYLHLHWAGQPALAARLVGACR
jgi:cobyrinic acid a,c-diamide synthase